MTDRTPTRTTNLDRYGNAALPWSRAHGELVKGSTGPDTTHFLGTIGPDGRPHVAGVGAAWYDGDLYFTSNLAARKARNLAANPACTIAVKLAGIDLTLAGTAVRASDATTLERIAAIYRHGGWPAAGRGRRPDRPVQRAQRGPATVAPLPLHLRHGRRRRDRRAIRRHPLALRALSA